jgi:hypothetical protein
MTRAHLPLADAVATIIARDPAARRRLCERVAEIATRCILRTTADAQGQAGEVADLVAADTRPVAVSHHAQGGQAHV